MNRYIYDEVEKMKDKISFSTPGHKGKDIFDFNFKNDVTETLTTDNLLNPQGCILDSQREISKLFGVESSHYIVNGSTGALHIALSLVTKPGDEVLIQRNSHKSVYNALVINDLKPRYIYANYNREYNLITGIEPEEVEKQLRENPNIKVVVVVSPNYFGVCLKIREIAEVVHRYNGYLIVDEAHGTHLNFSKGKDYSAINCNGDIIVHSTHKTTPSLTQTSLLHINTRRISYGKVMNGINLFSTTSPSYLMLQSSEYAVKFMEEQGFERLDINEGYIESIKKNLKGRVKFLKEDLNDSTVAYMDPSKILFRIDGLTGFDIVEKMFLRYNIRLEMGDLYYGLALSTVADEEEDFIALEKALAEIAKERKIGKKVSTVAQIRPEIIYNPRETFYKERKKVDLNQAEGEVSASIVAAYPPGIPIVSFGELITKEIVKEIEEYLKSGIEVVGISNNKLEVVV
ncbi:aminotransferase class I/II-fold pyridoxal phosphate-dependent enzyme [Anaerosphaera multitolerans]|uniref:Aminotransferase class I/II-fold pyridoxal phosphate-dependent enzyme n=1 Tax=Anaerosphaera multitolerans TaxID=2487351 RepID=A0A437S4P7_9FIRM|nr:aminotransferase class I/II-fold pyridoxal phosphate-dependent enzyme [Anaerosphaera multitolerans]RVU53927.1 aminotransferase class I/II-fold pyridoxal phosphate-dependent enzyme [Anaerosphaera multitolerans]